eukprot:TRINITY_DN654_c0_g1_i2.p1 TRINITY_DN654_c0_g1~~TRINITY_DN654_c0_g1_i2.p1  ORF type:complete len:810 (+),score=137.46 TRINITY_DN654_c0_g1_i2:59-2488(+)
MRRRSIASNASVATRRSRPSATLSDEEGSDVEAREKQDRQRMRQAAERQRLRHLEASVGHAAAAGKTGSVLLDQKMLQETVKASLVVWRSNIEKITQNKLNIKNAWSFQGMDTLRQLAQHWAKEGDFHTSSVAIESAAKIFAYRVDALGMQADRVRDVLRLGANATKKDLPPEEEDQQNRTAVKKRRVHCNTLAAEDTLDIRDDEKNKNFHVDPLFATLALQTNRGISGSLLGSCPIGQRVDVQIDSAGSCTPADTCTDQHTTADAGAADGARSAAAELLQSLEAEEALGPAGQDDADEHLRAALQSLKAATEAAESVAPTRDGASSDGGDCGGDYDDGLCDADLPDVSATQMLLEPKMQEADAKEEEDQGLLGIADACDAARAKEQLMNVDDCLQDNGDVVMTGRECSEAPSVGSDRHVDDASSEESNVDVEQKQAVLQMRDSAGAKGGRAWQGPFDTARWRVLRKSQSAASQPEGKQEKGGVTKALKRRREFDRIDFGAGCTSEESAAKLRRVQKELKAGKNLMLARGRARVSWREQNPTGAFSQKDWLSTAVLSEARMRRKINQPADYNVTTDVFFSLHSLSTSDWSLINKWRRQNAKEHAGKVTQIPFDINLDAPSPEAAPAAEDSDDDGGGDCGWDEPPLSPPPLSEADEAMREDADTPKAQPRDSLGARAEVEMRSGIEAVEDPAAAAIPTVKVAHARVAKVIDIKRLKEAMWHRLRRPVREEDSPQIRRVCADGEWAVDDTKLSDLISVLQTDLKTNKHIAQHLSHITFPFYLICLLHLCNDHGLKPIQTEDLSDVHITALK